LNGHCFYERRPLRTDATSVMAVHHNYISGDDRKFERARAYHAIVDENDKTWGAFARRSRAAMEANASWSPVVDAVGSKPNPAARRGRLCVPRPRRPARAARPPRAGTGAARRGGVSAQPRSNKPSLFEEGLI